MNNSNTIPGKGDQRGSRRWRKGLVAVVTASAVLLGAAGAAGAAETKTAVSTSEMGVSSGGGWAQSSAGVRW